MAKKDKSKGKPDKNNSDTSKADAGPERRVAKLRDKLTEAMQDPLTRDQIVRAIRALMQEK